MALSLSHMSSERHYTAGSASGRYRTRGRHALPGSLPTAAERARWAGLSPVWRTQFLRQQEILDWIGQFEAAKTGIASLELELDALRAQTAGLLEKLRIEVCGLAALRAPRTRKVEAGREPDTGTAGTDGTTGTAGTGCADAAEDAEDAEVTLRGAPQAGPEPETPADGLLQQRLSQAEQQCGQTRSQLASHVDQLELLEQRLHTAHAQKREASRQLRLIGISPLAQKEITAMMAKPALRSRLEQTLAADPGIGGRFASAKVSASASLAANKQPSQGGDLAASAAADQGSSKRADIREICFAGGCFWGVEEYFSRIPGVLGTNVGYANGSTLNPSYQEVCTGTTGHAETVYVTYNARKVSLTTLTRYFFEIIDPLSVNRQGNDRGSQYRSAVWYLDKADEPELRAVFDSVEQKLGQKLATELGPLTYFSPAEEYHQDYLKKNPFGYCHIDFSSLDKQL